MYDDTGSSIELSSRAVLRMYDDAGSSIEFKSMQLTEHRNEPELFVRHADAHGVAVVDWQYKTRLTVAADRVVEDFPVQTVAELDAAAIASVLALQPEVVLLGTGTRAMFPAQAILAEFLKRGIGLET